MKIKNLKYTKPSTFEYQGRSYSLKNLQPLHIMVSVKGKDIPVKIEFGSHVFTEKYDSKIHAHALQIQDVSHWKKAHYRAFDIKRYSLSLNLPSIFKQITPNSKFYNLERNKCLVRQNNYYIFFTMRYNHKNNMVQILVQSAYIKHTPPPKIRGMQDFEKLIMDLQK